MNFQFSQITQTNFLHNNLRNFILLLEISFEIFEILNKTDTV